MTLSAFDHEVSTLKRDFLDQHGHRLPSAEKVDVLQFCANHFNHRLESQRAELLLAAAAHSTPNKGDPESTFTGGMQPLPEEGPTSPSSAPPTASNEPTTTKMSTSAAQPMSFGQSGFVPGMSRLPPMEGHNLPDNYNFNRRTSVSAESINPEAADNDSWTPPSYPKTAEQQARLREAVSPNFLFAHLDEEQTAQVLGALREKSIPSKGIKVIEQGDVGDYFYVVENGTFEIYLNPIGKIEPGPEGMGNKVAKIGPGGSFGELALMYNAPRAATVVSTEPSTLWALDRVTFRRILMDSAFQRRRLYETFLSEVPLLEGLTAYERSKIADALNMQKFQPGQTIIKEGDPGESFFLLENGEAEVFKHGQSESLRSYNRGDYFGELALLDDKPRAASVIAKSEVKAATLGKEGFQRLLGPVEDLMRRNDPSKRIEAQHADPLSH